MSAAEIQLSELSVGAIGGLFACSGGHELLFVELAVLELYVLVQRPLRAIGLVAFLVFALIVPGDILSHPPSPPAILVVGRVAVREHVRIRGSFVLWALDFQLLPEELHLLL